MKSLSLQPLTLSQLPQSVALDRICFGGLWTVDGYQRELESPNSDLLVLCHENHGLPSAPAGDRLTTDALILDNQPEDETYPLVGVGCEWAIVDEAHITLVGVHPRYQRQGLGGVLVWAVLMLGRQRGLDWATLEVRPSNQSARSLYDKFGFELVGQRRRYYADTGEDALILWLKQLQSDAVGDRLQTLGQGIYQQLLQQGWQLRPTPEPLRLAWAEVAERSASADNADPSRPQIVNFTVES